MALKAANFHLLCVQDLTQELASAQKMLAVTQARLEQETTERVAIAARLKQETGAPVEQERILSHTCTMLERTHAMLDPRQLTLEQETRRCEGAEAAERDQEEIFRKSSLQHR